MGFPKYINIFGANDLATGSGFTNCPSININDGRFYTVCSGQIVIEEDDGYCD